MRKNLTGLIASTLLAASVFAFAPPAVADEVKLVGAITKITLAADGKSAVAVLKNVKGGEEVTINITDNETLDKFKDKRIVVGDEIRSKYDNAGGKNASKLFKKTAGC